VSVPDRRDMGGLRAKPSTSDASVGGRRASGRRAMDTFQYSTEYTPVRMTVCRKGDWTSLLLGKTTSRRRRLLRLSRGAQKSLEDHGVTGLSIAACFEAITIVHRKAYAKTANFRECRRMLDGLWESTVPLLDDSRDQCCNSLRDQWRLVDQR
jgi:hypothetical protein